MQAPIDWECWCRTKNLLTASHCSRCGAPQNQGRLRYPPSPRSGTRFGQGILALIAALALGGMIGWPLVFILLFFGLLVLIAAGVWRRNS